MKDAKETDPREQLRRLAETLGEEPPDDEEARQVVAALGIDIPAMAAQIDALAAAREAEERASLVRQRRRRAAGVALGATLFVVAAAAVVIALR